MRIPVRTATSAILASRLAALALPVVVIPILLHRQALVSSSDFHTLEAVALGLSALALLLSLFALVRLWYSGDRGWRFAVTAFFVSLLCLAPFAYAGLQVLRYPPVLDVATDVADPPDLSLVPASLAAAEQPAIVAVFPNLRPRNYPLGVVQVYDLATRLAADRGWQILQTIVPRAATSTGGFDAVSMTLLGWREEVGLRIRPTIDGSLVDMRSASLSAIHDLGSNGQRIEDFLLALDNAVTLFMRDIPVGGDILVEPAPEEPAQPVEEEDSTPAILMPEPEPEG